jgi:peptidoglycan hydrolase-like protein with peptidoglycan-binding domain
VRKSAKRAQAATVERGRIGAAIMQHPREFVAILVAAAAVATIFANALFLQHGPHPAPIFASRPLVSAGAPVQGASHPTAANRAQLIGDIQRALGEKGFYKGTVDGIWGPETDGAVRDFAQAARLNIAPDASANLLHAIKASNVQAAGASSAGSDPIAHLLAPSKQVQAIQRALTDFGYGQIKPTGVYDADTRAAIEKFERDRKLPVTGRISDTLVQALATMTGRPLE